MAQLGSALDWGSRGRRFKSCRPDGVSAGQSGCRRSWRGPLSRLSGKRRSHADRRRWPLSRNCGHGHVAPSGSPTHLRLRTACGETATPLVSVDVGTLERSTPQALGGACVALTSAVSRSPRPRGDVSGEGASALPWGTFGPGSSKTDPACFSRVTFPRRPPDALPPAASGGAAAGPAQRETHRRATGDSQERPLASISAPSELVPPVLLRGCCRVPGARTAPVHDPGRGRSGPSWHSAFDLGSGSSDRAGTGHRTSRRSCGSS